MNLPIISALRGALWREGRAGREGVDLYLGRPGRESLLPRGTGAPVLLVPGYLAGDASLAPLAASLRRLGHEPRHAGIAINLDCATRTAERLGARLASIAASAGERVVVVGHSLGGVLARVLAVQHPDLVRGIVCLGSPLVDLEAVHPLLRAHVRLLGALADAGLPRVLSSDCLRGECCAANRDLLHAPLARDIAFVSVYSRSDGVVDWRSCLAPGAVHVEVDSSHIGMPVNAAVHRVLAQRLAALG